MNARLSERITQWFHTPEEDHVTPYQTVRYTVSAFIASLTSRRLVLSVPYKIFHDAACELVCRLYIVRHRSKWISNPRRTFPEPSQWSDALEAIWQEHCATALFGDGFWAGFWGPCTDLWEGDLPHWRSQFESIAPFYVMRSLEVLKSANLLYLESNGEYVAPEDHEESDD
jgi:hypothetical protein